MQRHEICTWHDMTKIDENKHIDTLMNIWEDTERFNCSKNGTR